MNKSHGKGETKATKKKRKLNQNKKDYTRQKRKEYIGSKMNRDLNLLSYVKAINTIYAYYVV